MSFRSQLVGSFSTGAAGNPTVAMMDEAFVAERLDWRYVNCEVQPSKLTDAVRGAEAMGWRGFNCSIPHKQTIIDELDSLSETAELCQAVNCVVRGSEGWVGHNTDGHGFVASTVGRVELVGSHIGVIGSGGAAHAIAVEAALAGAARISLFSRNTVTARSLSELIANNTSAVAITVPWDSPLVLPQDLSLIVNATPVGMAPHPESAIGIDWSSPPAGVVAADVVVNPSNTAFLQNASEAGVPVINGRGMLVEQAAENIRLWAGIDPDRTTMHAALDRALDSANGTDGVER